MTRVLYLHGFASGPASAKGRAFQQYFAERGVAVECLDLRRPSLPHLRLSAIIAEIERAIAGDPVVLVGSSLGGRAAARVAEKSSLVQRIVLLAPAFRLFERWRQRLGDAAWARWEETDSLEVLDHTTGGTANVDFGFIRDGARVDAEGGSWPIATVPTWIAHGRRDDVVDIELSRQWSAMSPAMTQLVEFDDDHQLIASLPALLPQAYEFLRPALGPKTGAK